MAPVHYALLTSHNEAFASIAAITGWRDRFGLWMIESLTRRAGR